MKNLFYFPLEAVTNRYTKQLCTEWIPDSFAGCVDINFIPIKGTEVPEDISVGVVLDATGRGIFSLGQVSNFLSLIRQGKVQDNDILYFQDFWTPGVEAIFYALDLYKIKVKVYSTLWAQSVDEYDFTYPMRNWLRFYELGFDQKHTGIFVGSTVHKDQLKQAGFTAPIHVVSLPFHTKLTRNYLPAKLPSKENIVTFSSRLDWEKNPMFMLHVAEEFLEKHPSWIWRITTSSSEVRSNTKEVLVAMKKLAEKQPRFEIKTGLTKTEYYLNLAKAKILFNSSLQDYVSWTILEGVTFGADVLYPDFRSFTEMLDSENMYKAFSIEDCLDKLHKLAAESYWYNGKNERLAKTSNLGRKLMAWIIINGADKEFNIWHEQAFAQCLVGETNDK